MQKSGNLSLKKMTKKIVGFAILTIVSTGLFCTSSMAATVEPKNCATFTATTTQRCPTGTVGASFTMRECASCPMGSILTDTIVNLPCTNSSTGVTASQFVQGCSSAMLPEIPSGCSGVVRFQDGVVIASGTIKDIYGMTRGNISGGNFTIDACPPDSHEIFLLVIPAHKINARIMIVKDRSVLDELESEGNDLTFSAIFPASTNMNITVCVPTADNTIPGRACANGILVDCPTPDYDIPYSSEWDVIEAAEQCYAAPGSPVSDDTGVWEYTSKCTYAGNARQ